jgi:hypothetical protein
VGIHLKINDWEGVRGVESDQSTHMGDCLGVTSSSPATGQGEGSCRVRAEWRMGPALLLSVLSSSWGGWQWADAPLPYPQPGSIHSEYQAGSQASRCVPLKPHDPDGEAWSLTWRRLGPKPPPTHLVWLTQSTAPSCCALSGACCEISCQLQSLILHSLGQLAFSHRTGLSVPLPLLLSLWLPAGPPPWPS